MKLNIKAKDFAETNYLISRDCAITRALRRAGLKYHEDCGGCIQDENNKIVVHMDTNRNYRNLTQKVLAMYSYAKEMKAYGVDNKLVKPIKPKNFSVNIKL